MCLQRITVFHVKPVLSHCARRTRAPGFPRQNTNPHRTTLFTPGVGGPNDVLLPSSMRPDGNNNLRHGECLCPPALKMCDDRESRVIHAPAPRNLRDALVAPRSSARAGAPGARMQWPRGGASSPSKLVRTRLTTVQTDTVAADLCQAQSAPPKIAWSQAHRRRSPWHWFVSRETYIECGRSKARSQRHTVRSQVGHRRTNCNDMRFGCLRATGRNVVTLSGQCRCSKQVPQVRAGIVFGAVSPATAELRRNSPGRIPNLGVP